MTGDADYALVDGGVFVNNPSMAAYAEARSLYPDEPAFTVVSVGTGDRQDQITYASAKDWGLLGWAKEIVPVLMDSVSEAVDFELRALPGCTYYRLQVPYLQNASSDMDDADPENLRELQEVAKEYVASISDQLTKACAELKEGRGSNMPVSVARPNLGHSLSARRHPPKRSGVRRRHRMPQAPSAARVSLDFLTNFTLQSPPMRLFAPLASFPPQNQALPQQFQPTHPQYNDSGRKRSIRTC
jgi:hypothetical protein